jgi:hypothetical protein
MKSSTLLFIYLPMVIIIGGIIFILLRDSIRGINNYRQKRKETPEES